MGDRTPHETSPEDRSKSQKAKTLEAAGWAFLLLWLGFITLFSLGWPVFLIGLGVMVLALQAVRSKWQLPLEPFWLVLGVVFIVAGIVEIFGTGFPVVPVALILFGLAALYGAYQSFTQHDG